MSSPRKTTRKAARKPARGTTRKKAPKKAAGAKARAKAARRAPPRPDPVLDRALRVDHAGEYGALRIYQGQLRVLSGTAAEAPLREMLEHERTHLETFEVLLRRHGVRPTALQPFWHLGGWLLGATTAALGQRAAMACTVAVEEVIEAHYDSQVSELRRAGAGDASLHAQLERFAREEAEHRETARALGAELTPAFSLLRFAIGGVTRTAIRLSERI